jgi:hypothetical protein
MDTRVVPRIVTELQIAVHIKLEYLLVQPLVSVTQTQGYQEHADQAACTIT